MVDEKFVTTDKIFYHPDRVDSWLNGELVRPVTVELHLTNRCNCKCDYCSFGDRHDGQVLHTGQALEIIDKLTQMGVRGITFSGGGEPTFHPEFPMICAYARRANLDVGVITNGIVYPKVLEHIEWIRFSVDTCKPETYIKMRGVDKCQQVLTNIKMLVVERKTKEKKPTIGFQMVITEDNYIEIFNTLECAEELGVDYFQFRPVERGKYPPRIEHTVKLYRTAVKDIETRIHIVDSWYKWEALARDEKYTNCPCADFIGAVDAYGDFYMCCHHIQDPTAKYGNMITNTADEIIAARKNVQRAFDYNKCPRGCRGAVANLRLKSFEGIEHKNFI